MREILKDAVIQVCSRPSPLNWHYWALWWWQTVLQTVLWAVQGAVCFPAPWPEESSSLSWQFLQLPNPSGAELGVLLMHVCATCLSSPELRSLAGVHFSISWKEGTGVRCGSGLFLWSTEEIYFNTCCADWGCLRLFRSAALLPAASCSLRL